MNGGLAVPVLVGAGLQPRLEVGTRRRRRLRVPRSRVAIDDLLGRRSRRARDQERRKAGDRQWKKESGHPRGLYGRSWIRGQPATLAPTHRWGSFAVDGDGGSGSSVR